VIKIKNIPQINSIAENRSQKVVNLNKLNLNINKCISFDVNNIKLAIDINKISEIIEVDEITHSALESNLCMGMTSLRGKFIPLVDFSYVLEGVQRDWENKKIKVIVLSIKNNNIGVIVDRVVGINTFNSDDIMSLPVFSNQRASMFSGCIQTDLGDTFLIDSAELFSQTELGEISKGHNKIYEEDSAEDQQKKSNLTKKTYISFKLNYLLGISINDIKEIIEYPKEILNTPGLPSFALGLYNLRDSLVTIIDTRKLYQLSDEQSITDKKVLIIEKDTNLYGLVVDSIHSIHIIYEDSSMKLPDLLSREVSKDFSQDVQEVIKLKAEAEDDTDKALVVLDTNSLIRNIQNSKAS
jgi:purine-binding chemotaxis protein CheW